MKKNYLILITLLGIILILSSGAIYGNKVINIGNITMEIPNELQNGDLKNSDSGLSYYRNTSNMKNMFNIYVYSEYTSNYVKLAGFWLSKSNVEPVNIEGHPAMLVKDGFYARGNFTYIFFESDGYLVMINLPHSTNVTDTARSMIASTPPALYSESQFYKLINQTIEDYDNYLYTQDLIDAAYENGYYGGYSEGTPKGIFSRLFWRIGL